MAIISFLGSLKKDKSNVGQAAMVGAAAGLGTYYVTHETEWGQETLGQYDGVVTGTLGDAVPTPAAGTGGTSTNPVTIPTTSGQNATGGLWQTVKDNLIPIGAGVIVGASGSSATGSKWGTWLLIGAAAYLILK
jgi:hypothetical protein